MSIHVNVKIVRNKKENKFFFFFRRIVFESKIQNNLDNLFIARWMPHSLVVKCVYFCGILRFDQFNFDGNICKNEMISMEHLDLAINAQEKQQLVSMVACKLEESSFLRNVLLDWHIFSFYFTSSIDSGWVFLSSPFQLISFSSITRSWEERVSFRHLLLRTYQKFKRCT